MYSQKKRLLAGAHHAIEETVVLDEAVEEYMVSAILKGDIPVVSVALGKML